MKILVVGSGGREHAICWKLVQDDPDILIHAAPGNPGIATLASCHPVPVSDLDGLVALALALAVDLVVIGPEAPLAGGLADMLALQGIAAFGPSASAARIESSKRFAKELMLRHGIPTARATMHGSEDSAVRELNKSEFPLVIKDSRLAAGKGVFVSNTATEARAAIDSIFRQSGAGGAAPELLIEEFMSGEELSVFAVTDGENAHILVPSQDHKRLLEGDSGPNTGGMGAYAPVSLATPELIAQVEQEIIAPTLAALNDDGSPFRGLLYAGLMISEGGNPMVVEFNCRFGDPETQVVLPLLRSPLLELLVGATRAAGLSQVAAPRFYPQSAATTILAAPGYPDRPVTGGKITLPPDFPANTYLFHAGTRSDESGSLVTAGGRVFAVTGVADTLDAALHLSQSASGTISFDGMQWRRDIGWRELRRLGRGH